MVDKTDSGLVYQCIKLHVYQTMDYADFNYLYAKNMLDQVTEERIQRLLSFFNFVLEKERSYVKS